MKTGVVIFPGSNCDYDMVYALREVFNHEVEEIWHKQETLNGYTEKDCIILPGGFSYGDYLRSGAIARYSPIMKAVVEFANKGGIVIGICNGFQILCEAGLLPGTLLRNSNQKFICKNTFLKLRTTETPLTKGLPLGTVLKIPVAHADGRYYASPDVIEKLRANQRILFQYCEENGKVTDEANINGSVMNIAGICNKNRNVMGMMPHPERACEKVLGNTDGGLLLESLFSESLVI